MTTLAIVVSTYNRPDALAAVLNGYRTQRDADFELLVADDGSKDETAELVAAFRDEAPFPVRHVWHEDRGFRLAAIRNRALEAASADYVVFTDGDCVPHRAFTRNQKRFARDGWFVSGSRILLSESATRRVLDHESRPVDEWTARDWLIARWRGDVNRVLPRLSLPTPRASKSAPWHKCRGFSIAGWRKDFTAIDGFDESFEGWGLEDSDLAIRMLNSGKKLQHVRYGLGVVHLWHPENPRDTLDRNRELLEELQASGRSRARHGLTGSAERAA